MSPDALSRADLKHLEPLGHHLSLWGAAARRVLARVQAGRLSPALSDWLRAWLPGSEPAPLQPGQDLRLCVQEAVPGWQLVESTCPWQADPLWSAWLHLPALRFLWAAELRAAHLDSLRALLPAAWCLDPAPLPPGAVIAGLGIPAWHSLPALRDQGRSFTLARADAREDQTRLSPDLPAAAWREHIAQALARPRMILAEAPPAGRRLHLCFTHHDERIQMESALPGD